MLDDWQLDDPVHQALRLVQFVSSSKGRGRTRNRPTEVFLVIHGKRATTWGRFPFDEYAQELLPMIDPQDQEEELKRRLGGLYL